MGKWALDYYASMGLLLPSSPLWLGATHIRHKIFGMTPHLHHRTHTHTHAPPVQAWGNAGIEERTGGGGPVTQKVVYQTWRK